MAFSLYCCNDVLMHMFSICREHPDGVLLISYIPLIMASEDWQTPILLLSYHPADGSSALYIRPFNSITTLYPTTVLLQSWSISSPFFSPILPQIQRGTVYTLRLPTTYYWSKVKLNMQLNDTEKALSQVANQIWSWESRKHPCWYFQLQWPLILAFFHLHVWLWLN